MAHFGGERQLLPVVRYPFLSGEDVAASLVVEQDARSAISMVHMCAIDTITNQMTNLRAVYPVSRIRRVERKMCLPRFIVLD